MKGIAALWLLVLLQGTALSAGKCPATERQIVGAWSLSRGAGHFEQFMLALEDGERVFHSWLHDRPDVSGAAWRFEDCRLIVVTRHGASPPLRFEVIAVGKRTLRLRDASTRVTATYARWPDDPSPAD